VTVGDVNETRNLHARSSRSGASHAGWRASTPFAILDAIYKGQRKFLAMNPSLQFPPLKINWSISKGPTAKDFTIGEIGNS
jgi:hypothetical protein